MLYSSYSFFKLLYYCIVGFVSVHVAVQIIDFG